MGQVRHGCATTTHAVRAAIQRSQASLATLGRELGINPKTVAKWRKRTTVEDLKTEPKAPRSTTLFEAEEAMIVAFRCHTLLPLDDCPYALQPSISARGAWGLQGWRRNQVYPDFLLRLTGEGERLLMLETKGKQLDNDDTAFKRELMAALQNAYERPAAGEVELFEDSPKAVRLTRLMQEDNWKPTLAGALGD